MQQGFVARWATVMAAVLLTVSVGCAGTSGTSTSGDAGGTGSEFSEDPISSEARGSMSSADLSSLETVYFDYDQATIRSDAGGALRNNAVAINGHEDWGTITIEGHCDERGSDEYNLALGEKRANGVKQYLVDLGVPDSRFTTVSFGEAKPSVPGHAESAWRYNRRAQFSSGR